MFVSSFLRVVDRGLLADGAENRVGKIGADAGLRREGFTRHAGEA
jgi:hypothetical protein